MLESTQRRIQKLPENLINLIAAGEVVERPASILKELVENSLDAGATQIHLILKDGGIEELTVIDNGWGIDLESLPLAFERHATSKLQSAKDLESIESFGFRGEALSSIASVSDITCTTRDSKLPYATKIHLSFGKMISPPEKAAASEGTRMTVRSLFSKIPARFKFLRTGATELSHCLRVLKEMALANANVEFSLIHHDRNLAHYTRTTQLKRFKEVIRPTWEPEIFTDETDDFKYEMFLSPHDFSNQKGEIFLFVNHRPVRNRILVQAVKQAYQEVYGPFVEPSGAVWLSIRHDWVDPNVHPQKWEVRFLKQERLFQYLLTSLRKQLAQKKSLLPAPAAPSSLATNFNFDPSALSFSSELGIRFVSALPEGFLLFCEKDGLVFSREEKLREEILLRELASSQIKTQKLAIPVILSLSASELKRFEYLKDIYPKLGWGISIFGDQDIAIQSCLEDFPEGSIDSFFRESLQLVDIGEERLIRLFSQKLARQYPPEIWQDFANSVSENTSTHSAFFKLSYKTLTGHFT